MRLRAGTRTRPCRRAGLFLLIGLLSAAPRGLPAAAQAALPVPTDPVLAWAPWFSPDPGLAAIGLMPEPLGYDTLARAAFLASGVDCADLAAWEARLSARLEEVVAEVRAAREPGEAAGQAEELLGALHRRILKSYSLDATTLTEVLDRGRFNCVSSAVLYLLGLERLGLGGGGVKTSDHAFCFVILPGGRQVDVETTNPWGFDPGTKKEFTDAFGSVTGYSYVPPGTYGKRRPIGEKALVALILSNRSAILERRGDYAGALAHGTALHALQGDAESRLFLLDRVNNLVASLVKRRDFIGAEGAAGAAIAALGPEPRLLELARTAAYDRALSLYDAGRLTEALDAALAIHLAGRGSPELASLAEAALGKMVAARLKAGDPGGARRLVEERRGAAVAAAGTTAGAATALIGEAAAARILAGVTDTELVAAAGTMAPAAFAEAADRAWKAGQVEGVRRRELIVYAYGTAANRLAAGGDWLGAAALAAEGAARLGGDTSLSRAAGNFRGNFAVDAHNRFVTLYNARDWQGALTVIEAAIALLPGEATLLADRNLALKARGP